MFKGVADFFKRVFSRSDGTAITGDVNAVGRSVTQEETAGKVAAMAQESGEAAKYEKKMASRSKNRVVIEHRMRDIQFRINQINRKHLYKNQLIGLDTRSSDLPYDDVKIVYEQMQKEHDLIEDCTKKLLRLESGKDSINSLSQTVSALADEASQIQDARTWARKIRREERRIKSAEKREDRDVRRGKHDDQIAVDTKRLAAELREEYGEISNLLNGLIIIVKREEKKEEKDREAIIRLHEIEGYPENLEKELLTLLANEKNKEKSEWDKALDDTRRTLSVAEQTKLKDLPRAA